MSRVKGAIHKRTEQQIEQIYDLLKNWVGKSPSDGEITYLTGLTQMQIRWALKYLVERGRITMDTRVPWKRQITVIDGTKQLSLI